MTNPNNIIFYIASPLFSEGERDFIDKLAHKVAMATNTDIFTNFFIPHRDANENKNADPTTIFCDDRNAIDKAKIIIAILDGQDTDSGTSWELGYAYALNKKVFGLLTDFRLALNIMIWGGCEMGNSVYYSIEELVIAVEEYFYTQKISK